jgi:transposase
VKPELVPFNYNFKCLKFGKKEIQVDSIRTDGIQASVVIKHKLTGNHKEKTSTNEEPVKKKQKIRTKSQSDYLIGIDPGVVTLMSCADSDGKKWEFSNKQYHHFSHHTKNKKKLLECKKAWNALNNKSLDELHNSIKQAGVSSSELFREHVQSVLKVEDDLLDFYCHPSVKRLNWDSYIMRSKTIAKVMKDFSKRSKGRKMTIGMGNAGFGSCYKGNDPAPKGKLLKKLNERFEVKMIDEFMTSQTCCACHSRLKPVKHKRKDKKGVSATSIVRGIKQCKTTGCLITHNRDLNAAKNMLHLLRTAINGEEKPDAFMRKKKLAKELKKKIDGSHEVLKSSRSSKR